MRFLILVFLALFGFCSSLPAEVLLLPHQPTATPTPEPKIDRPAANFIVPFFEVDTANGNGQTTLFAIRNVTVVPLINVLISYTNVSGNSVFQQLVDLAPNETRSFNLRDVPGLVADPDGFARGAVLITAQATLLDQALSGDFFQVDVANRFATGDRLVTLDDLCLEHEIRFLDFGSGTKLRIFLAQARGDSPTDPPSFTVEAIGEDGNPLAAVDIRTDQNVVELASADVTDQSFGTLIFDFTNSQGGYVFAEYSADGRFSVGLNATCLVPPIPLP